MYILTGLKISIDHKQEKIKDRICIVVEKPLKFFAQLSTSEFILISFIIGHFKYSMFYPEGDKMLVVLWQSA